MPRDYARFNVAIWQDDDWRALPWPAQYLYKMLWTHPQLNYCGVVDWRPARLTGLADGLDRDTVETLAQCLEARLFVIIDPTTEELLIRSWARYDGLMRQPRMAVSFANAYAAVASKDIRGVLVHESRKIRDREPDLAGWAKPAVADILDGDALNPRDRDVPADPFATRFGSGLGPISVPFGPNATLGLGPVSVPPTPSPTPTPYSNSVSAIRPAQSPIADAIPDVPRIDVEDLCKHLADRIESNGSKRPAVTRAWRDAARLMLDKDGRTLDHTHKAIDWSQDDEFWRTNILSMGKLREKYDQLRLAAQRASGGRAATPATPDVGAQAWVLR